MPARRPLVIVNGVTQELPSTDSLIGALSSQDVTSVEVVTQAEYDALSPPNPNTLYLIEGVVSPVTSNVLTGIEVVTQAEYDALSPPNPNTAYLISDAPSGGGGGVSQAAFDALLAEVVAARGSRSQLGLRIDTISNFVSPNAGGIVVGSYYDNSFQGTNSSTLAGAANRIDMAPYYTSMPLRIDQIGVSCTTAATGAQARLAIYSSGTDGWPDELLYESGVIDLSTSGYKFAAVDFTFDTARQYWLAIHHSSTATIRSVNLSSAVNLGNSGSTSNTYYSVIRRTVTFANGFPTAWNFTPTDRASGVTPPSIRMRAATI